MHNLTHGKLQIKIHFVKTLDGLITNSMQVQFADGIFSVFSHGEVSHFLSFSPSNCSFTLCFMRNDPFR